MRRPSLVGRESDYGLLVRGGCPPSGREGGWVRLMIPVDVHTSSTIYHKSDYSLRSDLDCSKTEILRLKTESIGVLEVGRGSHSKSPLLSQSVSTGST